MSYIRLLAQAAMIERRLIAAMIGLGLPLFVFVMAALPN